MSLAPAWLLSKSDLPGLRLCRSKNLCISMLDDQRTGTEHTYESLLLSLLRLPVPPHGHPWGATGMRFLCAVLRPFRGPAHHR